MYHKHEQLPKIAEAVAKGYTNVDSIKMFGGDTSRLAGDIMTTVTQVSDGIKESTGVDVNALLSNAFRRKDKAESPASAASDFKEVDEEFDDTDFGE